MGNIRKSKFSTSKLSHTERYAAWRESISAIFDVSRSPLDTGEHFNAKLNSYLIDDQLMISRCKTVAQRFERSSVRTATDGLDYYLIQTHISGGQEAKRGSKVSESRPGDLLVIDLADVHAAETTDFEHITAVVPRPLLAPMLTNPDSQEGRVLDAANPLTRLAVSHLMTLGAVLPHINEEDAPSLIEPTLGIVASALNGSTSSVESGPRAAAASLLSRAKMQIEQNLQNHDLSAEAVCGLMQISRASVYRLFEPYGGVRAYIQERRLRRAASDLTFISNAQRPIYDIAFNWGFASEAHFSRAFKRRFGLAPRDFRKQREPSLMRRHTIPIEPVGDRNYEQWLGETLKS